MEQERASDEKLLTLGDFLKFLRRRRLAVLTTTLICFSLALVYCAVATRRYLSEALIEIKQPEDSLGLNKLVQGTAQGDVQNPLEENVILATKVSELESETLALRVIQDLRLESTPDFAHHLSLNPFPYVLGIFMPKPSADKPGTSFMESPSRRAIAFRTFESHLKVTVVPGTRLIAIDYQNPDPVLAAAVANSLAKDLAEYSYQTRYQAVQQLSSWLGDQLDNVRAQAETLQGQEASLRRQTETYTMGGTNAAGQTLVYSPLLDHLQQATLALSQAESNRILRGAVAEVVKTRNPILISGLAGSGIASSGNPESTESLATIRQLLTTKTERELLLSQDEQRYGSANPKLIQDKAQLKAVEDSLDRETERLQSRASNDLKIATDQESGAAGRRNELIARANLVNDKVLQYEILHQEASDARELYTNLNSRLREAGVLAGLQSNDMTVVSIAFASDKPASPRIGLLLAASVFAGLVFGLSLAIVQDVRDDKVNSVDIVESELGIPVYAVTPDFNAAGNFYGYGRHLARYSSQKSMDKSGSTVGRPDKAPGTIHVVSEPSSPYAEAMRGLRTAILLARSDSKAKTILVTSSTPGEGKSTTSVNLAATFARNGAKTLLVEIDLRKPVLARRLALPASTDGLSDVLTGQLSRTWVAPVPGVPNLFCLPAGRRPPDPHELLSSEAMKELIRLWDAEYDIVVLDGAPVLPVIDSVLLSEQVDLVLVITRFGRTTINSLRTAHRLLSRQVRANVGSVLNAVSAGSEGYYEYYGYRNSSYSYGGDESE